MAQVGELFWPPKEYSWWFVIYNAVSRLHASGALELLNLTVQEQDARSSQQNCDKIHHTNTKNWFALAAVVTTTG